MPGKRTPKTTHHIHLDRGHRVEVFYIAAPDPISSAGTEGLGDRPGGSSRSGSRSTHTHTPSRALGRRPPVVSPPAVDEEGLNRCFHCGGDLVYPLDWVASGPAHWRILLRCPECEATREGAFHRSRVERLDDELDRAAASILGDLRRLTHANMQEELDVLVRALEADLIDPEDFQR